MDHLLHKDKTPYSNETSFYKIKKSRRLIKIRARSRIAFMKSQRYFMSLNKAHNRIYALDLLLCLF